MDWFQSIKVVQAEHTIGLADTYKDVLALINFVAAGDSWLRLKVEFLLLL